MSRHVDVVAVLILTLLMLGFSRASVIAFPLPVTSLGFENAISNGERCPIPEQILSRITFQDR